MSPNEPKPKLTLELDPPPDSVTGGFAMFALFGFCPSVLVYLYCWLCGSQYVLEIMIGLNALGWMIGVICLFRSWFTLSRRVLKFDRVTKTFTSSYGSESKTQSIARSTRVVLYHELRHHRRNWGTYFVYHLVFEAESPIYLQCTSDLLPARARGQSIAEYLNLPFDDQTRELTDHLLPRDVRTTFGAWSPKKRKQLPNVFQLSIKGLIIVTLAASVLIGLGVYLTQHHYRHAPLVVPIGSFALWFLIIMLCEEEDIGKKGGWT